MSSTSTIRGCQQRFQELGVLAFASYPPSGLNNAVTRLWDQHMRPDWRKIASEREAAVGAPRDRQAERRTVDELNERIERAEAVPDEAANLGPDGPDYVVLRRFIPAKKGKWRMVSRDVERAGPER